MTTVLKALCSGLHADSTSCCCCSCGAVQCHFQPPNHVQAVSSLPCSRCRFSIMFPLRTSCHLQHLPQVLALLLVQQLLLSLAQHCSAQQSTAHNVSVCSLRAAASGIQHAQAAENLVQKCCAGRHEACRYAHALSFVRFSIQRNV